MKLMSLLVLGFGLAFCNSSFANFEYHCSPSLHETLYSSVHVIVEAEGISLSMEGDQIVHQLTLDSEYRPKSSRNYIRFGKESETDFLSSDGNKAEVFVYSSMLTGFHLSLMKFKLIADSGFSTVLFACQRF